MALPLMEALSASGLMRQQTPQQAPQQTPAQMPQAGGNGAGTGGSVPDLPPEVLQRLATRMRGFGSGADVPRGQMPMQQATQPAPEQSAGPAALDPSGLNAWDRSADFGTQFSTGATGGNPRMGGRNNEMARALMGLGRR